jgi:hypothetical protein
MTVKFDFRLNHVEGVEVLRRRDASPSAVLGVVIAKELAQVQKTQVA